LAKTADAFCAQCGFPIAEVKDSDASDPLVGRTLPGGYRIVEPLAEGSMGRVYRAEQKALGRAVAVKVMNPGLVTDPGMVERFRTEARAASSLNHPNCVRVLDFGTTQDGRPYIVMELLSGHDLAEILGQAHLLPVTRVLDITLQILGALEEAHSQGVVHRDLKPGNVIIMTQRGGGDLVKVVDFGLAKLKSSMSSPTGLVFGTPEYISPEQATAAETDNRTDLYGLGVMLFEMLTGRLPFRADTPREFLEKHVRETPPRPGSIVPAVSDLDPVVEKALAKAPADRFESAEAFAEALREVVAYRTGERNYSDRRSWVRTSLRTCSVCGNLSLPIAKFCGECGEPAPRDSMPVSARHVMFDSPRPEATPPEATAPAGPTASEVAVATAAVAQRNDRREPLDTGERPIKRIDGARDADPLREDVTVGPTAAERRAAIAAISDAEASGDASLTLVLLEQLAAARIAKHDPHTAIAALKRGIDIARRDLDDGQLDDPIRAVAIFTGKLGEAFLDAGLHVEARAALKDSLALTRAASERAKLWLAMSRLARAEGHSEDALEYVEAAEREIGSRRNSEPPSPRPSRTDSERRVSRKRTG